MKNFKPFLALEASAGSGKTFALSIRFICLILMGAKIDEILAITFTRKAANEMKKRIIDTFLNLNNTDFAAQLSELCLMLDKNEEEILILRDKYKENFLRTKLKIQTFDSFFTQIIRVFSLNLGFMSDFDIKEVDDDIRDIFIKNLSKKDLKILAKHITSTAQTKLSFFENLEFLYQNSCELKAFEENIKLDTKDIEKKFEKLKFYALDECKSNEKFSKAVENKNYVKNFVFDNLKDFCKKPIIADMDKKYFDFIREDPKFISLRKELIDEINKYCLNLYKLKINTLLYFLSSYSKMNDELDKNNNTLSFSSLSKKAYELSQNLDKELIYFRLDSKISHLLIDEFQDTNILQYKILKPIIAELVSGHGVKDFKSFFYVGDKKQSIYKFRNTQKELFDLLQRDFKQIQRQILDTNYRSKKEIVSFVNEVFANSYKNLGQDFYPQKCKNEEGGFVKIIELDSDENIKEELLNKLLEQIKILLEYGTDLNDISVLCWKNEDADDIVFFLKEHNINAFTQSNIELEKKASVFALLEFAKYCVFGDEFYAKELEALGFKNISKLELDMAKSPMQTLLYLAKKLRLDLSDISLLQFIEYSSKKENFLELLFEPCHLKIKTEQSFGVSVMTVHKSKGLEFDTVILFDSISKAKDKDILLEYDVNKGFELEFKNDLRAFSKEEGYIKFKEKHEFLNHVDDINKLYVAFTRACENLFIIKRQKNSKLSILNLKEQTRGELRKRQKKQDTQSKETENLLQDFVSLNRQEEVLVNKNTKDSFFGMALHYALELMNFKQDDKRAIYKKMKNKFHHNLDEYAFKEIEQRCEILSSNEDFLSLLKDKKIFKEQKFVFNKELKQLDLLAIGEKEAIIIDYKSSKNDIEKNIEQVNMYKKAISSLLKDKEIKAFIIFCLSDKIEIQEL